MHSCLGLPTRPRMLQMVHPDQKSGTEESACKKAPLHTREVSKREVSCHRLRKHDYFVLLGIVSFIFESIKSATLHFDLKELASLIYAYFQLCFGQATSGQVGHRKASRTSCQRPQAV